MGTHWRLIDAMSNELHQAKQAKNRFDPLAFIKQGKSLFVILPKETLYGVITVMVQKIYKDAQYQKSIWQGYALKVRFFIWEKLPKFLNSFFMIKNEYDNLGYPLKP